MTTDVLRCDGCGDTSEKLSVVIGSQPLQRVCPDCMSEILFARLDAIKQRVAERKRDAFGPSIGELAASARKHEVRQ
jgi:hypothetical protein